MLPLPQYALVGYTDVLRDELRDGGIFVATVNPGEPRKKEGEALCALKMPSEVQIADTKPFLWQWVCSQNGLPVPCRCDQEQLLGASAVVRQEGVFHTQQYPACICRAAPSSTGSAFISCLSCPMVLVFAVQCLQC